LRFRPAQYLQDKDLAADPIPAVYVERRFRAKFILFADKIINLNLNYDISEIGPGVEGILRKDSPRRFRQSMMGVQR